jgi:hypothetical protein
MQSRGACPHRTASAVTAGAAAGTVEILRPSSVPDELRAWLDNVIIPILLEQFIREIDLRSPDSDGEWKL